MTVPLIGITMGEPAGVGPEIIVKSLAAMDACKARSGSGSMATGRVLSGGRRCCNTGIDRSGPMALDIHHTEIPGDPIPFGKLDPRGGEACFRFIEAAVREAEAGEIACIVTAPINKAALNAAGHHYDGHTGHAGPLTGSKSAFMLLASERLNVIHVSTHVSLRDAIDRATTERVLATIRAGHAHLAAPGHAEPAHRRGRHQSALRRGRPVRHRG